MFWETWSLSGKKVTKLGFYILFSYKIYVVVILGIISDVAKFWHGVMEYQALCGEIIMCGGGDLFKYIKLPVGILDLIFVD